MSQENVEIVRESMEAFNRGDFELALSRAAPDIEWQTLDSFPDAGTYRGPEGVRKFFETWLDTFQGFRVDIEDCMPVGEDFVLATSRVSGEGAESGAGVESPEFFQLVEFRDGLVIRAQMFGTRAEALEAAGLSK